MIFQEPMTSLSALHTFGNQIVEAVQLHRQANAEEAKELAAEMLAQVGFPHPTDALMNYPFELSGGLRQRAMIAMALVCRPVLLIADEPTTALDVTKQAQILCLIKELQSEPNMALLLITHDLGVLANMADEVVVAYHGKLMESGLIQQIFDDPKHPYLKALMRAVPRLGMKAGERLTPSRLLSCTFKATSVTALSSTIRPERWPPLAACSRTVFVGQTASGVTTVGSFSWCCPKLRPLLP